MKSENLKILKEIGLNVPKFIDVKSIEEVDMSFSEQDMFAIRSSFDAEDNENASFAGQFDTVLNVKREEVKDAFKKVKKSTYNNNAKEYNNTFHENEDNMTIIIQEMVQADFSGVIFTANPIGILNEFVIVVGKGLGNNVVEDKISTTTYYYNADDDMYYYDRQDNTPILKEKIIKELVEIAKTVKRHFHKDMDIEFAIKDEVIYILQARPITTIHTRDEIILDNSNIVESYPGISLPLTQSFVKEIYYKVFKTLVFRLTKDKELVENMDSSLQYMTDIANGRIYYRISNWYCVLRLLPFSKKIIKIWQTMLGVNNTKVTSSDNKVKLRTKCKIMYSFIHFLNITPKEMKKLNTYFKASLSEYWDKVNKSEDINSLLLIYEDIKEELTSKWDITLINDMYAFIYTALSGKNNKARISNINNLESMKPVIAINELMEKAKICGIDSEEYIKAKEQYIDIYGDRVLEELKLETKTYRTNPELLERYIESNIGKNEKEDFSHLKSNTAKTSGFFVRRAKLGIYNREVSRLNRSRIFGIAREIMIKIGKILEKENIIESFEDVFYLFYEEISAVDMHLDYKKIIRERKEQYASFEKLPAFSRLVFSDKVIDKHIQNVSANVLVKDKLYGIASSVGKVKGEGLVIDNPSQDIDTSGKIIVTKMTDPAWSFLIKNCLGIIAEKGSILSHTAIITRELGKPSVVNVKDATVILKNGDLIELDAEKGIIKRLEY